MIQIHLHLINASFCRSGAEAEAGPLGRAPGDARGCEGGAPAKRIVIPFRFHHIYTSCKSPCGVVTSPRYSKDILLAGARGFFSPVLGGFSMLNLVSSVIDLLFFIVCLHIVS